VSEYSPLSIVDVYGLSETGLIAMGCRSGRGLHVFEDACLVELVKPDGDRVVGTDEIGEIVITRLGSPSLPLVRYRTGDAGTLDRSPCPCGRTAPRLNRIQRLADRLIIGQRALFPLDVDEALIRASAYAEAVVIERSSERLHLQLSGIDGPLDQVHLTRVLSEDLNVPVSVEIKSSENLSSFFHKTIRVVDDGNRDVYRAELEFQRELEHA
jgi:phenylacetate-CoA ligase